MHSIFPPSSLMLEYFSEHTFAEIVEQYFDIISVILQEAVTLLEYSLIAVTEGIDAIATTRVLIRTEKSHMSTHALTGEITHRTFR